MPSFDASTLSKLADLRTLYLAGTSIEPFELVKINWPSPTGSIYYANRQTDEIADPPPPVSPIEVRLMVDPGSPFLPINQSSSIGDESVDLKFWDGPDDAGENDGAFSDLLVNNDEGAKIEFFLWFPQVELLLPVWEAHLRAEDEADRTTMPVKAAQGFRASDATTPHWAHYLQCQAVFGGTLPTQEQIDELGCNYNLHLGGLIGIVDPDTGLPFTFCLRLVVQDCIDRGVSPLRHMSDQTIVATVIGTQSSGGPTFSTSEGNATNLKDAKRVIMGRRRAYNMQPNSFIRHPVNSNPDHGFFDANYEACVGPIEGYEDIVIEVGGQSQSAVGIHLSTNRGNLGQVALRNEITTHGFSGTALIGYNFGWINPANVDQNDAKVNAIVRGLRDVRVYSDIAAGAGLIGRYYTNPDFTSLFGTRVDNEIDFPQTTVPPFAGMILDDFSVVWSGFITIPDSDDYTFYLSVDDEGSLAIDGDEIITAPSVGDYTSAPVTLAAGTYPIEVRLIAGPPVSFNPWRCVLEWEVLTGLSLAREVVPESALSHVAVENSYIGYRTDNRAWQIARILCDKRWGIGKDYSSLNMDSWRESAAFVANYVRFTDTFGNNWDHFRGLSNVDLQEKKIQQQIEDMCLAGELSRPYLFDGKEHISPLKALTGGELADCPVFTDEGENRNIVADEDGKSTLKWSRKSSFELKNRVECTYDSAANNWLETTAPPVEDVDAQLAAGRVIGDGTRKINILKIALLGVDNEAHAVKMSWRLLDLGEFDEGGLQNNLRVTFTAWFMDALEIYPSKVIKVANARMNGKYGFDYFRVVSIERRGNLQVEIEAQAYNVDYMDAFETVITYVPPPPPPPPPGHCIPTFGVVTLIEGQLEVPIEPCIPV